MAAALVGCWCDTELQCSRQEKFHGGEAFVHGYKMQASTVQSCMSCFGISYPSIATLALSSGVR